LRAGDPVLRHNGAQVCISSSRALIKKRLPFDFIQYIIEQFSKGVTTQSLLAGETGSQENAKEKDSETG
jgi:hypothetical protein